MTAFLLHNSVLYLLMCWLTSLMLSYKLAGLRRNNKQTKTRQSKAKGKTKSCTISFIKIQSQKEKKYKIDTLL